MNELLTIKQSPIHGLGVFSQQPVKKGSKACRLLWRGNDLERIYY